MVNTSGGERRGAWSSLINKPQKGWQSKLFSYFSNLVEFWLGDANWVFLALRWTILKRKLNVLGNRLNNLLVSSILAALAGGSWFDKNILKVVQGSVCKTFETACCQSSGSGVVGLNFGDGEQPKGEESSGGCESGYSMGCESSRTVIVLLQVPASWHQVLSCPWTGHKFVFSTMKAQSTKWELLEFCKWEWALHGWLVYSQTFTRAPTKLKQKGIQHKVAAKKQTNNSYKCACCMPKSSKLKSLPFSSSDFAEVSSKLHLRYQSC